MAETHGVRRKLWYRYVNTESFATLRENPIFEQPPDGYSTTFNMSATFEVSENYGESLTSYLQVELMLFSRFHANLTDASQSVYFKYHIFFVQLDFFIIFGGTGFKLPDLS